MREESRSHEQNSGSQNRTIEFNTTASQVRFIVGSKVTKAPNDLGLTFPVAQGRVYPRADRRHRHSALRQNAYQRRDAAQGTSVEPRTDGQGPAGSIGILTQTGATRSAAPKPPGQPRLRDHRRATPGEAREVRQDLSSRAETRRSRAQAGTPPGRTQGLRHEHPRHMQARTGLSLKQIITTLRPIHAALIETTGKVVKIPARIPGNATNIIIQINAEPGH